MPTEKKAIIGAVTCVVLGIAVSACRPPNNEWETIGELSDTVGNRYLVRQVHYDLIEGWKVSFGYISQNGEHFRYYLAHESPRWPSVQILKSNDIVQIISESGECVATFLPSNGAFTNHLNGVAYDRASGLVGGLDPRTFFDH